MSHSHSYLESTRKKMERLNASSTSINSNANHEESTGKSEDHEKHKKLGASIGQAFRRLSVDLSPHKHHDKHDKHHDKNPQKSPVQEPLPLAEPIKVVRRQSTAESQMLSAFESENPSPNLPPQLQPTLSLSPEFELDSTLDATNSDIWKEHPHDVDVPPVVVMERPESHGKIRGWRRPSKSQKDAPKVDQEAIAKAEASRALFDELPPLQLLGRLDSIRPVLNVEIAEQIRKFMPAFYREVTKWQLLYSLEQHGISLNTLYRLSEGFKGSGVIAIRNTEGDRFGAYVSETLVPKERYYGSGECFLWKELPDGKVKAYKATGINDFMIHTEHSYLSIGGGDGVFGLWVDGQLYHGHSQPSTSFDNETLCEKENFTIVSFEFWGLKL